MAATVEAEKAADGEKVAVLGAEAEVAETRDLPSPGRATWD
jgi:hypothetical protein